MLTEARATPWYRVAPDPVGSATTTLLCFPWAGAGTAVYHDIATRLAPDVRVWRARLPGREDRVTEPPAVDAAALVTALADAAEAATDGPYALFGHSFGALLAAGVAAELAARGAPAPQLTIVSGAVPPSAGRPGPQLSTLDDDALLATLARAGGVPADLLELPELCAVVLPALRADIELSDGPWAFSAGPRGTKAAATKLPGPLCAFAGRDDPLAPPPAVRAWRDHSDGPVRFRAFPGSHLFPLDHPAAVTTAIIDELFRTGRR